MSPAENRDLKRSPDGEGGAKPGSTSAKLRKEHRASLLARKLVIHGKHVALTSAKGVGRPQTAEGGRLKVKLKMREP